MQLSSRYQVQRRSSNTATALVIVSLLLGSAGAMSALSVDARGPVPPPGYLLPDADGSHGLR